MLIRETALAGAFLIDVEPFRDERGMFARLFCEREFAARRITFRIVQSSMSSSRRRGTVRGMHFHLPPVAEGKLIFCTRGAIFDVLVDLRPDSPTYMRHLTLELDEASRRAVYVPPGFAHAFQTLADDTDVLYHTSDFYRPELYTGVRWNDPAFGIRWPLEDVTVSDRDNAYPDFDPRRFADELRRRAGAATEPAAT
jgi:dTDP-4-dehydrorhamnose 3,5-epimerase